MTKSIFLLDKMAQPNLVFIGTSGGGEAMLRQLRSTGGFRINGSLNIHVDPGPGALSTGRRLSQNPEDLNAIVITHKHIDHCHDAPLLIEAIMHSCSQEGKKPECCLIGSETVLYGDENKDRGISLFDQKRLGNGNIRNGNIIVSYSGKALALSSNGSQASIICTKTSHRDKTGFGFTMELDGIKTGYTSDTEYFDGLPALFEGCNILIANNIRPDNGGGLSGHLYSETTARLLSEVKPLLAIITHFGVTMLDAGPENEAKRISDKSGVQTVAACDGMSVDLLNLKINGR
jgi:phosphoribosyl 1,2-cyclic phosphodiesterase